MLNGHLRIRLLDNLILVSMIQVYTGDGKGKTTAALGLILRAVARGKRVALVAFDKGGKHYAERDILAERFPEVSVYATGLDRIDPDNGRFRMGVTDEDRAEGERGLEIVRKLFDDGNHGLIVLDEINCSCALGIIKESEVLTLLDAKPEDCELVMTGRNAPKSFRERADLVTEMNLVKHYFYSGIKARDGFDF